MAQEEVGKPEEEKISKLPSEEIRLEWTDMRKDVEKMPPLPFQTIETINESKADREANRLSRMLGKELPEWKNKLIWGENRCVMSSLLNDFAGKIDLIYIDPPFATGADFYYTIDVEGEGLTKEPSMIEEIAYRDTWGRGLASYLQMMYDRLVLMRDLLSENGSIYVHLDWHVVHHVRIMMDEIFGVENFVNEIIWERKRSQAWATNRFGITNDTILLYSKAQKHIFNPIYSKRDKGTEKYIRERFRYDDGDGRKYMKSPLVNPLDRPNLKYEFHGVAPPPTGWLYSKERMEEMYKNNELLIPKDSDSRIYRKIYLDQYKGQLIQNIWTDIPIINPMAKERLNFDTQKPEALLERIISTSSNPDSLVADFFCGSGTTLVVAEKLGRRWVGCDLSRFAIQLTRKRLLEIPNCNPFDVVNLGKYERQYWQTTIVSGKPIEQRLDEYYAFILKLYKAEPLTGFSHIHGRKGSRLVHVGAVDAPVTLAEIEETISECIKVKQDKLDILGWEFEMGIDVEIEKWAQAKQIDLQLKRIPREVMDKRLMELEDEKPVTFFDLGVLNIEPDPRKGPARIRVGDPLKIQVTYFNIPHLDLVEEEEVRKRIKRWEHLIDYWSIDWDYQEDTFHNQWQDFRKRKKPEIRLKASSNESEPRPYQKQGNYKALVKVIDIFGNDTTRMLEVHVR